MFRTPREERLNNHSVSSEIQKYVTGRPYLIGGEEYRQSAIISHRVGQTAPALQQQIVLESAETTMREHPSGQLENSQAKSQQIITQFPPFNQKDYPQESKTEFAAQPKQQPPVKKFLFNEMPRMIIKIEGDILMMFFKNNIRRYLPWSELDLDFYMNLDEKTWNLWRTYLYLLDKSKYHKFASGQQFQDQLQKSDRNHVIPEVYQLKADETIQPKKKIRIDRDKVFVKFDDHVQIVAHAQQIIISSDLKSFWKVKVNKTKRWLRKPQPRKTNQIQIQL